MRNKTISHLFDNIMWYGLYLLPVILFMLAVFRTGDVVTLTQVMSNAGLSIFSENFVYVGLNNLFGSAGVMPLFVVPDILAYSSYFISVFLVHLAVDVLLFIPRFAHKCMSCFGGDK